MTPVERFEYEPGIVFPDGTQKLEGPTCEGLFSIFEFETDHFDPPLRVQGSGCFAKPKNSQESNIEIFNTSIRQAGYELYNQDKKEHVRDDGQRITEYRQVWLLQGLVIMTLHVEDSKGSVSFLASIVGDSTLTPESVATISPATLLAFDTKLSLPPGTNKVEGTSCEAAAEDAMQVLKELNQSEMELSKFRCYELHSGPWQEAAQQVMSVLKQGGYGSKDFTDRDSALWYQVWSKANSQYPLHVFFGSSRLEQGVFFVVMR